MPSFFFAPVVSKKKRVIGWGEAHGYNVGASIYEQARASREPPSGREVDFAKQKTEGASGIKNLFKLNFNAFSLSHAAA